MFVCKTCTTPGGSASPSQMPRSPGTGTRVRSTSPPAASSNTHGRREFWYTRATCLLLDVVIDLLPSRLRVKLMWPVWRTLSDPGGDLSTRDKPKPIQDVLDMGVSCPFANH